MLKRYTFTEHDGRQLSTIARNIVDAIRKTGVRVPKAVRRESIEHCGGDCGDCQGCAFKGQAI